jgi:hypothetical protein
MGTAAQTRAVESSLDSTLAQESTSPHIVGRWHAGLWLSGCGGDRGNSFSETSGIRIAGNRERAMKDWTEGEIRWIALEAVGERYRRYRLPDAAAMESAVG